MSIKTRVNYKPPRLFFPHFTDGPVTSEGAIDKEYKDKNCTVWLGQDIVPEVGKQQKKSQTPKDPYHCQT